MNKVVLMGRLTRDPEVRYSQSAEPVAIVRYTLAVNRRFKRENDPDCDFINCTVFGKPGEFASKYFKKGMMVCVSGRLQVSSFEDKETKQKRWSTDVILDDQQFAESKASFESRDNSSSSNFDSSQPPTSYSPNKNQDTKVIEAPAPDGFYSIDESLEDEDLPF